MSTLRSISKFYRSLTGIGKSENNLKSLLNTKQFLSVKYATHSGRTYDFRILRNRAAVLITFGGSLFGIYSYHQSSQWSQAKILLKAETKVEQHEEKSMSRREKRFHDFASTEYNQQVVMTPLDFIESLVENEPRLLRSSKIRLTEKDVKKMIKETPGIEKGSHTFFRDLQDYGIITYSEYLFLVTVLTKSTAGLKTALKMMDVNGDHIITVEEFETIVSMINRSASKNTRTIVDENLKLNHTTLLIHLFGVNGNNVVSFERFFKFMDDFHSEVLELEFHQYSKSLKRISEIDFAKILLRNTILTEQEYSEYLDRLKTRIEYPKKKIEHIKYESLYNSRGGSGTAATSKMELFVIIVSGWKPLTANEWGITLDQFKSFHYFLSNIEDFIISVNMTNVLNQPIDKDLFTRSVQVTTGTDIDPYVIDVIFKLFDQDGDGKLSQNEFIGIMKDRLKRGFGKFPNLKGFEGFKRCLKKEMNRTD